MKPAIEVDRVSKLYRLSHEGGPTGSFREALTNAVRSPLRRFRQLRGADNSLEEFWALRDVGFTVMPGQVMGIIGRNGAGKSTLLKILSRIVEPTQGRVTMRGRVASLLEVGTGFHPELTGRENIFLNGSILGMRRREIERKFDEIVDFAEIERFLDTPVKRYSSGMYVRLAFAVAAHLDPEILIVDEVLAVGDAVFQRKCMGKLQDVSREAGRTVLFVSHNLAAIRSLCTHGVVLRRGQVSFTGAADDACNHYLEATAAADSMAQRRFKQPRGAPMWMESATVATEQGPAASFPMGSSLSLCVDFKSIDPIKHPRLGFVIQTASGDRLVNSNNRYQPSPAYEQAVTGGRVVCDLGAVPWMPGKYLVSLWFGDTTVDHHVELESLTFEVTDRDLWGIGQLPPAATPMWWPTSFRLEPLPEVEVEAEMSA